MSVKKYGKNLMQDKESEPQRLSQQCINKLKNDIAAARYTGIQSSIEVAMARLNNYMDSVESKKA